MPLEGRWRGGFLRRSEKAFARIHALGSFAEASRRGLHAADPARSTSALAILLGLSGGLDCEHARAT